MSIMRRDGTKFSQQTDSQSFVSLSVGLKCILHYLLLLGMTYLTRNISLGFLGLMVVQFYTLDC